MGYSREFFTLQVQVALRLTALTERPASDVFWWYTTLSKTLNVASPDEWQMFLDGLGRTRKPEEWAYQFYQRGGPDPDSPPSDGTYQGHRLFGNWYYQVRDGHILRPYFVRLDSPRHSPLSRERHAEALRDLREMFRHIAQAAPEADTVAGNSWLYNLEGYRRLFPPAYTASMAVSEIDEFQYLAIWGQFYDKAWQVKEERAAELFRRLDRQESLTDLRLCFPLQVLQPRCPIEHFYDFYGLL